MAKDPAFLFYHNDFLVGTNFMTDEEVGKYIRLLCYMADKGKLSESQVKLICKGEIPELIKEKLTCNGDKTYYNQRLLEEVEKRKAYAESRRNNRLPKHMKNISVSYDGHMENENENIKENKKIKEEEKKNTLDIFTSTFNSVWAKYPNKVGKKAAIRHFNASVKTENDAKNIELALENYLKSERVYKGFIQNAATWFNNWQDWIDYKEEICQRCHGKGTFISSTGYEIKCNCKK